MSAFVKGSSISVGCAMVGLAVLLVGLLVTVEYGPALGSCERDGITNEVDGVAPNPSNYVEKCWSATTFQSKENERSQSQCRIGNRISEKNLIVDTRKENVSFRLSGSNLSGLWERKQKSEYLAQAYRHAKSMPLGDSRWKQLLSIMADFREEMPDCVTIYVNGSTYGLVELNQLLSFLYLHIMAPEERRQSERRILPVCLLVDSDWGERKEPDRTQESRYVIPMELESDISYLGWWNAEGQEEEKEMARRRLGPFYIEDAMGYYFSYRDFEYPKGVLRYYSRGGRLGSSEFDVKYSALGESNIDTDYLVGIRGCSTVSNKDAMLSAFEEDYENLQSAERDEARAQTIQILVDALSNWCLEEFVHFVNALVAGTKGSAEQLCMRDRPMWVNVFGAIGRRFAGVEIAVRNSDIGLENWEGGLHLGVWQTHLNCSKTGTD